MKILDRIDQHLEFHETIVKVLDAEGAFKKQHDRHKSDIGFLESIKGHIGAQDKLIRTLEMNLKGRNLDGSLIPSTPFSQSN